MTTQYKGVKIAVQMFNDWEGIAVVYGDYYEKEITCKLFSSKKAYHTYIKENKHPFVYTLISKTEAHQFGKKITPSQVNIKTAIMETVLSWESKHGYKV